MGAAALERPSLNGTLAWPHSRSPSPSDGEGARGRGRAHRLASLVFTLSIRGIRNRLLLVLGLDNAGPTNDYEQLKQTLALEPKDGPAALWLVLIGHGSFDGKEARFNLRGPDVTATELALWLRPFRRPLAVIDTSSSSAPF